MPLILRNNIPMNCHRMPVKLQHQVCKVSEPLSPAYTVPTVRKLIVKNYLMKRL